MAFTVHYFPARGRAELVRLVLVEAGQEFKDERHTGQEWPQFKPDAPLGQMPYLEEGDKNLGQSLAITRYLANKFDMAGGSDFEKAVVDSYNEEITDMLTPLYRAYFEKDPTRKSELDKVFKETFAKKLAFFENLLTSNPTYLVGDKVTYVDLRFMDMAQMVATYWATALESSPQCQAHVDRMAARPRIKAWLDSRPVTNM